MQPPPVPKQLVGWKLVPNQVQKLSRPAEAPGERQTEVPEVLFTRGPEQKERLRGKHWLKRAVTQSRTGRPRYDGPWNTLHTHLWRADLKAERKKVQAWAQHRP